MQVQEIGTLETPIALTNTLNVGKVADAMISWMIQQTRKEGEDVFSINPVVGECNDSRINEICNRVVGEKELYQALEQADTDFAEGDIGAGTGTICYGLKGGIGSSSRTLVLDGKTYTIRELASQEMKNSAGATWDAATAGNAIGTWTASFGDQIDVVVSNNDGMGMSMFNAWAKDNKVPTFGYDANSDAVAAIGEGYGGTISQHADVQAYLTLRVLRNALDGVDINTGIGTADEAGNCLTEGEDYRYSEEERSYYALNIAVTADNYNDFTDSTKVYDKVAKQLDESKSPSKKVWLNIYNASDNFLSSTYQPLLEKYDDLLNLKVDYIGGDGQTESNITNRLGNPSEYDAFAINMVKTDNAAAYTSLLSK